MRQQLSDYEQRLYRLLAAKENELKATLADLKQHLDGLAAKFQACRDAPSEKSPAVLQELEAALKEFASAFEKFDSEARPAKLNQTADCAARYQNETIAGVVVPIPAPMKKLPRAAPCCQQRTQATT